MRRLSIALVGLSFALAGCLGTSGADDATTTLDDSEAADTTAPPPTSSAPSTSTSAAPLATDSERPVAPDFTLELGDGGEYTLYEGAKPVYLVFWAEW